jgi:hypothetical protein
LLLLLGRNWQKLWVMLLVGRLLLQYRLNLRLTGRGCMLLLLWWYGLMRGLEKQAILINNF